MQRCRIILGRFCRAIVGQFMTTRNGALKPKNEVLQPVCTRMSAGSCTEESVGAAHGDERCAGAPVVLPKGMLTGENGRAAYAKSSSVCLDLFFQAVPHVSVETLHSLLQQSWRHDPNCTVRIIFNVGNCRQSECGKCDKVNFERCLLWLLQHHPRTLLFNLQEVHRHGSLQTLLNLVMYSINKGDNCQFSLESRLRRAEEHQGKQTCIRQPMAMRERKHQKGQRRLQLKHAFAQSLGKTLSDLVLIRDPLWKPDVDVLSGENPVEGVGVVEAAPVCTDAVGDGLRTPHTQLPKNTSEKTIEPQPDPSITAPSKSGSTTRNGEARPGENPVEGVGVVEAGPV